MKNYLKSSVLVMCIMAVSSCSTRRETNPSAVMMRDGTITIVATGEAYVDAPLPFAHVWLGENPKKDAEIEAFRQLLFRGFPASQQSTPLIGYNEDAILQQFKPYFEQLFGKGRYWSFVIRSKVISEKRKAFLIYKDRATVEITINYRALRADMEQNGVIRRFGY